MIQVQRGQIVVVDFGSSNPKAGVRPALIVQCDQDNQRMTKTVVIQITSNVSSVREPSKLLIDQQHPDWSSSGLRVPSLVNCSNIATIEKADVLRALGTLSPATMGAIEKCLKYVLDLG